MNKYINSFFSTPFSVDNIPDLTSKVAVVTGANTGIGYEVALELARHGCRVYLACRNKERALATLQETATDDNRQILDAATTLLAKEPRIHLLVNNAVSVNHLGPTLFTQQLLSAVTAAGTATEPARIIFTSSRGHNFSYSGPMRMTLAQVNDAAIYSPLLCYGYTKLANILTAKKMARQMATSESNEPTNNTLPVIISAVHPGVVASEISRYSYESLGWFVNILLTLTSAPFSVPLADGALTTLFAATAPEAGERQCNGAYFIPYGQIGQPSAATNDEQLQDQFWEFTQDIFHEKLGADFLID
ncbi:hypothetical protein BDF19DRAFT_446707 [Syncephalis fuscata]|nr:hypothetical protein BDF19DRAFT_446707 [Syncephalis fuscata]